MLFRMNLTENDIIDLIENYKNKFDLRQGKMAELCGMANASVYNKWVNKKTDGGKIKYFLDFLNNTDQDLHSAFPNRNKAQNIYPTPESKKENSQDCISKQKEIDALRETINAKEELLDLYREKKQASGGL